MGRVYGGMTSEQRVADRRARVLEAGLECFGTVGFARTGVKDVCRAAGLTDRYFYESFKDSRALFLAVFDSVTDELFAAVANATLAVEAKPEQQLHAAISTFLTALDDDPRRSRVVFAEAAAAGPEAAQHMRATLRRFTDLVEATAQAHGVHADRSRVIALSLVGTLERAVSDWQDGELPFGLDALAEQCVELYAALISL